MKITVDTQQDRFEDIQRVFQLLGSIIEQKESRVLRSNFTVEEKPAAPIDTSNLMNMFETPASPKEVPNTAPDFNSFLSLTKTEEEKKAEKPQIELY